MTAMVDARQRKKSTDTQLETEATRPYHEVAGIFPPMEGEAFDALKDDIAANGLIEPIILHPEDDSIVDGRNRHRACIELGIVPDFTYWHGAGSLVEFVVSLNLKRRHLEPIQRAAIGVDMLPMLEEEARKKQLSTLKQFQDTVEENFPQRSVDEKTGCAVVCDPIEEEVEERAPQSRDIAAKATNTNERYISDMKRYKEEAPDVFAEAKAGKINGNEAKKLARMPEEKRAKVLDKVKKGESSRLADAIKEVKMAEVKETAALPTNLKYRVIYADPPWKYGNTMPDYFDEQGDHYPLMTVQEIAAMPVVDMADDNAVLFLWVTSPILEESFRVVNSWGFKYKASFIWDKVKHVMGHYNSVRHEILLVCTRGSCQPDVQKLFDSVQTIERTEHSAKPEEFRQIIDTIYPYGKRVELFARRKVEGWDTWGNEA